MYLLQNFFWKGHRIFVESYFTSTIFARELYFKDTFIIGTAWANRVGISTNKIEELKLEENQLKTFYNIFMHFDVNKDKKNYYIFYQMYIEMP